jgi:hypothetical protein
MLRCTGTPTSTFGGGGGTKLFCSQALSATNADMAKAILETAAALCLTAPFSPVHAAERAGFIPCPIQSCCRASFLFEDFPRCSNSNNLLAVELERENDATEFFDRLFQSFISVEAPTSAPAIRIFQK